MTEPNPYEAWSILKVKMPDGAHELVGETYQPVSMKLPDGSWRTWPGTGGRLRQKQADGSWRDVVYAPGAEY